MTTTSVPSTNNTKRKPFVDYDGYVAEQIKIYYEKLAKSPWLYVPGRGVIHRDQYYDDQRQSTVMSAPPAVQQTYSPFYNPFQYSPPPVSAPPTVFSQQPSPAPRAITTSYIKSEPSQQPEPVAETPRPIADNTPAFSTNITKRMPFVDYAAYNAAQIQRHYEKAAASEWVIVPGLGCVKTSELAEYYNNQYNTQQQMYSKPGKRKRSRRRQYHGPNDAKRSKV